jgi:dTDP-4-amino-4,6-dideoxygalactose transaminase
LKEADIMTMVYYPVPIHLQKLFSFLGYREGDFIEAEKASKEVISLPIFPELKSNQLLIIKAVSKFFK